VIEAARRQPNGNNDGGAPAPEQKEIDPQLAGFFVRDAQRAASVLEEICKKNGVYGDADIQLYTTSVHAMKSALANVSESELSLFAAELEQAGRNKDTARISLDTPEFLSELKAIIEKLTPAEESAESEETPDELFLLLQESMIAVKEACKAYDKPAIKVLLSKLRKNIWPHQIKKLLDIMSEQLLDGDFYEVSNTAEKLVKRIITELTKQ